MLTGSDTEMTVLQESPRSVLEHYGRVRTLRDRVSNRNEKSAGPSYPRLSRFKHLRFQRSRHRRQISFLSRQKFNQTLGICRWDHSERSKRTPLCRLRRLF